MGSIFLEFRTGGSSSTKLLCTASATSHCGCYYGFYCWVSETYARQGASTDFDAWKSPVLRAEALYALVSAQAGEGSVGEIDWANRRLAEDQNLIDFAGRRTPTGRNAPICANPSASLAAPTIPRWPSWTSSPLTVPGCRWPHANWTNRPLLFSSRLIGSELAKLLKHKIREARVTVAELDRLAPITPSQIDIEGDERAFYDTVLFARDEEDARSRAATLLLVLDTARACEGRPGPEDVRWHLFDPPADALPEHLEAQRLKWEALSVPGPDAGRLGRLAGLGDLPDQL